MNGWEIVCPDGKARHYPYTNFDDAESDARLAERKWCQFYKYPGALEREHGPCPGGKHEVRPVVFAPPSPTGEA